MSLSVHHSSVSSFEVTLEAFVKILDKAAAHAEAKRFDPNTYLTMRLRPDMFTFARQVLAFCDQAKNAAARLAGVEPQRFPDDEASLEDLKARIAKTLAYIRALDRESIDHGATRELVFPVGATSKLRMQGANYLLHFALPNYYFHLTTAYDLLRYAGVEIVKRDYLGAIPGATPA